MASSHSAARVGAASCARRHGKGRRRPPPCPACRCWLCCWRLLQSEFADLDLHAVIHQSHHDFATEDCSSHADGPAAGVSSGECVVSAAGYLPALAASGAPAAIGSCRCLAGCAHTCAFDSHTGNSPSLGHSAVTSPIPLRTLPAWRSGSRSSRRPPRVPPPAAQPPLAPPWAKQPRCCCPAWVLVPTQLIGADAPSTACPERGPTDAAPRNAARAFCRCGRPVACGA